LNPIEVNGQHLYDSVTKEPFHAAGLAFPNKMPDDPQEWVKVLKLIGKFGNGSVNMIRLYEVPPCIWWDLSGSCFTDFMKEADKLGIYVLFPATGSASGFIPRDGWETGQQAYCGWAGKPGKCIGKPLNMGRGIVQRTHYPNTLAIVIGNEFFLGASTFSAASVFKAYARDMKSYMKMCNEDDESPSKGHMRQVPIMYAARDFGDDVDKAVMSYLKCGSADISIDIYGLNVERWCDPATTTGYDGIHKMVENASLPGVFMFSEMGCPQNLVKSAPEGQTCRQVGNLPTPCCPRNWNQIPDFFEQFTMFDGFSAYALWNDGALNFNMVDTKFGNGTLFEDGLNFFSQTQKVKRADRPITAGKHPTCPTEIVAPGNKVQQILPLDEIKAYDEDKYPAKECPGNKLTYLV
jgi:hypothetical protein